MVDENTMNPRRSFSLMGSNYICGGEGGGFHQFNNNTSTNQIYLPFTSISQLFSDAGMSSYGSYPPTLYSSPSLLPHQPPLLPLPFSDYGNTLLRSKNNMKNKKKNKKKKNKVAATKPSCIRQSKEVPVKKAAVVNKEEEETGEEFLLSPSPSSLPLPRMLLTARPKAEAVDASDDLRRLLRL